MASEEVKNRVLSAHRAALKLAQDIVESSRYLTDTSGDFPRRMYVRAAFAYFEAAAHVMRLAGTILQRANIRRGHDTLKLQLLSEYEGVVKENGSMKVKERGQRAFTPNVAFAFRTLAEELGESTTFLGDSGWEKLQRALQIRNRLTHPKQLSDVVISDEDVALVIDAHEWFNDHALRLLSLHKQRLDKRATGNADSAGDAP